MGFGNWVTDNVNTGGQWINPSHVMSQLGGVMGIGSVDAANKAAEQTETANKFNAGMQLMNYDYQKKLQQQLFAREDNAVQRAAADMEAAGLSKTLAAGAGSGAGQAISTVAPYMDKPLDTSGAYNKGGIAEFAKIINDIGVSSAQKELIKENTESTKIQNKVDKETADIKINDAKLENIKKQLGNQQTAIENDLKKLDIQRTEATNKAYEKLGIPVGTKLNSLEGFNMIIQNKKLDWKTKTSLLFQIGGNALLQQMNKVLAAIGGKLLTLQ